MTTRQRYLPNRAFPDHPYLPGKGTHPNTADPVVCPLEEGKTNDDFLYALDLFHFGYFWESHLYFEAFWNRHQRKGSVALFSKSMIMIAAARIKIAQSRIETARVLLNRASQLLQELIRTEGSVFHGVVLPELLKKLDVPVDD